MLIPLRILISRLKDQPEQLSHFLETFSCTQDHDIEFFLHNRAIDFETLSKSRTYLICDKTELESLPLKQIKIYGYISIALKVLSIPYDSSNRFRKELDGYSAKFHGKPIPHIPCYLIGQLSRNSNVPKDSLSGSLLIHFALSLILRASETVSGRYVMIECHNSQKLIQFYQTYSFREFSHIPDQETPMIQMIRKI